MLLRGRVELLGEPRAGRRHVDDDAAVLSGKDAVFAAVDFLDVFRIADHRDDEIRRCGKLLRRVRPMGALLEQGLCLRLRARVDGEREPRLHEIAPHAAAHDADADEADGSSHNAGSFPVLGL